MKYTIYYLMHGTLRVLLNIKRGKPFKTSRLQEPVSMLSIFFSFWKTCSNQIFYRKLQDWPLSIFHFHCSIILCVLSHAICCLEPRSSCPDNFDIANWAGKVLTFGQFLSFPLQKQFNRTSSAEFLPYFLMLTVYFHVYPEELLQRPH